MEGTRNIPKIIFQNLMKNCNNSEIFSEITDYDNWLLLTPGPTCMSNVGLPGNAEGFHGGEVRIELGSECQTSDAVLRTMLLHAAGLIPVCFELKFNKK